MTRIAHSVLLSLVTIITLPCWSQNKPVQATLQVLPPYNTVYADYLSPVTNKFQGSITLLDISEPSLDVRLSIKIEGQGIRLETSQNYIPSPLTLLPGQPLLLNSSHLSQYMNPNNLVFFGISRQDFVNNGRFPEGFYTFSLTVREYRSGKEVSNPAITMVWLKLNDEPTAISPRCGAVIPLTGPQNIFFQWQLNTPVNSGIPFTPVYKFFLYEVLARETDPLYALTNGNTLLVYESEDLVSTSLTYSLSMPTLDAGKRYLYRIQAIDPTGNNEFRNKGFSPPCWFYYGYPEGGNVEQMLPVANYRFKSSDPKILEWKAPDNLIRDQLYSYRIKIAKIDDPDNLPKPEDFQLLNPWIDQTTSPTNSLGTYSFDIKKELEKDTYYAWYVTAHTGQQTIAQSEVRAFKGPSLVSYLKAGIHTVYVSDLKSNDLNNLTGTGLVKIYSTDTDSTLTEVSFSGLKVKLTGGRYVLNEGEIVHDIKEKLEFELSPRNKLNSSIYFYPKKIRLNKTEMSILGYCMYPFPHPVKGGKEAPMLKTKEGWMNFDRYKPYGEILLEGETKIDLLDPFGFTFQFAATSQIQLYYKEYNLQLDGKLLLSEKVKSVQNNRIAIPFRRAEQLYYIEEKFVSPEEDIRIIPNTKASFNSKNYVIDLSEKESPRKMSARDWKGVYFNDFKMVLHHDLDKNGQLLLNEKWVREVNQNSSRKAKAWVDGQGLDFLWEEDLRGEQIAKFNTFPAKLNLVKIDVENSALRSGMFEGSIVVAAIDPTRDIPFKVPADQQGFKPGYLTESLDNSAFAFNPYGGENKVEVTVRRAVFEGNDHLNLTADFRIEKFGMTIPGVQNFNLYGDYFIGFNKRNGAIPVSSRPKGKYDGQDITLIEICASLARGSYIFSYNTEVNMGAGFDGPKLSFHSITPANPEAENASAQNNLRPGVYVPELPPGHNPKNLLVDKLRITYENNSLFFTSAVELKRDHPTYGTHFSGQIEGELKIPAKISLGGSMIYGKTPHEFFKLDAFFVDEKGVGITVYPNVNMVGAEGWIYHGMQMKPGGKDGKSGELVLDKSNDFGFNLFGQFIDQATSGATYQLDGTLAYSSGTGDVALGGKVSMINTNVRDPSATSAVSSHIKQKVAEEAVRQVLSAVGGIDKTVTIEGVDLRLILTESSGSLGIASGGYSALSTIDVKGTPSAALELSNSNTFVKLKGDVRDAASAQIRNGSLESLIDYKPNSGGKFALSNEAFKINASVNSRGQSGDLLFEFDKTSGRAVADLNSKTGTFKFKNGERSVEVDADLANQKGSFTFDTGDGVIIETSADGKEKSGSTTVFYDGSNASVEIGVGFNQNSGTGNFDFDDGSLAARGSASKTGTLQLTADYDGNVINLTGDSQKGGTAEIDLAGKKVKGWIDLSGVGGLEYRNSDFFIHAEGNQKSKAGKFQFEKGDIRLAAAGDPTDQTGMVDAEFDGTIIKGEFSIKSRSVKIESGEVKMSGIQNIDSTGLSVLKGSELFVIGGNPGAKKGFVQLKSESNEIFVKADQSEKSGLMRFHYDGTQVYASVVPSSKSLSFKLQNLELGCLSSNR